MKVMARMMLSVLLAMMLLPFQGMTEEGSDVKLFDNVDLRKCEPALYDAELAENKKLADNGEFTDRYFKLQAFYAEAIWQMLSQRCDIMGLDARIDNSGMGYLPGKKPANVYQAHWSFGAKFLFLRNNVYIERLSGDELTNLEAYSDGGDTGNAEVQAFVSDTLRRVIANYPFEEDDSVESVYEPDGKSAPNNAVVLGVKTSPEYDVNGNYTDPKRENEKFAALQYAMEQAEALLSQTLDIPVKIFLY